MTDLDYALVVITDGRHQAGEALIRSAIDSFEQRVAPQPRLKVIINDDPHPAWQDWLQREYADRFEVWTTEQRWGFHGAVQRAFNAVRGRCEYVFHLEDDFTFERLIDVEDMVRILELHPEVAQVQMRRQPWNDEERLAGGMVQVAPWDFIQRDDEGIDWLAHRRFFTTNPSLYRESLTHLPWPREEHSEGKFHHEQLIGPNPDLIYAMLGTHESPPWCRHIGEVRAGVGY